MLTLLSVLLALQEERVHVTITLVKASQQERASLDPSLRELEADLKELAAFNTFELTGSAVLRNSPTSEELRTSVQVRDGSRVDLAFFPQQPLGNRVSFKNLRITEERTSDDVTITSGGTAVRTVRKMNFTLLTTTVEVPDGKPFIVGSFALANQTIVVVVKASVR
jgi:hypothetical protein